MRAMFMLASVALAAGCAPAPDRGGDASTEARPEPEAATFRIDGVVAIERVRTDDGVQTSVGAKFMRHAGLVGRGGRPEASAEAAERLVGSRLLLPANGECLSVTELEDVDALSADGAGSVEGDAEVELIDVGDVALVTDLPIATPVDASATIGPEARQPYVVRLAPRAFPDVGELVSGVFYTSPDLGAPLPAPGQYAIEGTGAALASAFELQAEAPAEPADVAIDGRDLARGAAATARADVLVTWGAPSPETGSPVTGERAATADRIYVDIQAHDGQLHRCAFEDSGSAIVPGALVTEPSVAVAVHRLRETSSALDPDAVDDEAGRVLIRFDLAVVGRIDVRRGTGG